MQYEKKINHPAMGQLSSDIGGQKAELLELPRQTFPAMSQLALQFVFILHIFCS